MHLSYWEHDGKAPPAPSTGWGSRGHKAQNAVPLDSYSLSLAITFLQPLNTGTRASACSEGFLPVSPPTPPVSDCCSSSNSQRAAFCLSGNSRTGPNQQTSQLTCELHLLPQGLHTSLGQRAPPNVFILGSFPSDLGDAQCPGALQLLRKLPA